MLSFAASTGIHFEFTTSPFGVLFAMVLLLVLLGTVFAAVHQAGPTNTILFGLVHMVVFAVFLFLVFVP